MNTRALTVAGGEGEKGAEACEHLTDVVVASVPRDDAHLPANTPLSTPTLSHRPCYLVADRVFFGSTKFDRCVWGVSRKWSNMGQHGSIGLNSPGQELSIDV